MTIAQPISIGILADMSLPESWELVDGTLVEMTPASGPSSRIGGRIYARFLREGEERGIGWAYPSDAGFILFADRQTVRSPDAAFVRGERLAVEREGFVPIPPDLAVEVLSRSDRMPEALSKVTMYLQAGVLLVWLVDPETRTITIFRPDAAPRTLDETDALDGGEVLPGFSVPVADIFA